MTSAEFFKKPEKEEEYANKSIILDAQGVPSHDAQVQNNNGKERSSIEDTAEFRTFRLKYIICNKT